MCALLVKRFSSSLHCSPSHRQLLPVLTPLLRVTLSTQSQSLSQSQKEEETPFIAQYLISSFGFSRDRALRVSTQNNLAAVKSLDRPESVICFLKDIGLSDSDIKAAISFNPMLLSCNADKTLMPRARDLMAAGFTAEILVQLIRYNPRVLALKNALLGLQFWREFVGNNDKALLKLIRRNQSLFTCHIDKCIVPRLNLFREYGLSDQQIMSLLTRSGSGFLLRSVDYLKRVLEQTHKLGFQPGSGSFVEGLRILGSYSESTLNRKIAFFKKTYGWSEDEVYSTFRKYPSTMGFSEERVKSHMDFLIKKAMLDPKSITFQPLLLGCSMERTLVPRHHVLTILKAHGLKKDYKLLTACKLSVERFLETCVVPHEKDVPGLGEAYAAACSGKVPP